jgi:hypothetical protein
MGTEETILTAFLKLGFVARVMGDSIDRRLDRAGIYPVDPIVVDEDYITLLMRWHTVATRV